MTRLRTVLILSATLLAATGSTAGPAIPQSLDPRSAVRAGSGITWDAKTRRYVGDERGLAALERFNRDRLK